MKTNTLDFDAQALREKILDLAMRGKLVSQDPNDEPASVLLEKIKAEKEQLIKEKKIKKSKPLAPISDNEKPFDIPDSWEWVRLGDVADKITDGTHNPPPNSYEGKQVISAINIKKGKIDFSLSDRFVSENQFLKEDKRTHIRKGDVLLTIVGSLGNAAVVDTDKLFTAQRSVAVIGSKIESYFLYYVLTSMMFKTQIFANAKGTTQRGIYLKKLTGLKLPLPPLLEQSRIAAKIAQLFALLRKVESSTQQYAKLQTLLKSKVLDLAMRGKLVEQDPHDEPASVLLEKIKAEKEQLVKEGKIKKSKPLPPITDEEKPFDIPDSWEWGRLGDILKPEVHKKPAKDFYYIDIASIDNQYNKVVNPKKVIVKKDKIASRARQVLENDDILFSVVRPYLRNIAMVPKDNNYKIGTTGFYVLKPYELINRKYIFCLTLSNYTVTNMTQKMRGDNSPSIRKSDMQNLIIPIPPRMEQDKIVNMIIRIYSAINLN
ncbi:restriction endonuclease subunit S [Lactobacillus crispatus]|uniref:Restriction endonuclease subunit S n=1 Tax=Lactobacillus crispatus TaxID=47770 RepID=A0A6A1Z5V1_9LACO|nr:restriction endonuclease subunit S [Lactobacillus crispatus]KAB1973058.1 restriction endonuclease subunit S [Lactobacillus crispatus]MCT3538094.1 restriction endonuclease subunit S [Lactobacillus crispatus]